MGRTTVIHSPMPQCLSDRFAPVFGILDCDQIQEWPLARYLIFGSEPSALHDEATAEVCRTVRFQVISRGKDE